MKPLQSTQNGTVSGVMRRGGIRLACAGSLVLVAIATIGWSHDDAQPDLSDVFPNRAPRDLRENAWQVLGSNWEQWSSETAAAVRAFYDAEDVAARRAALERLHVKLNTMETALGDPQYAMIHAELAELHSRLNRRVTIAEAVLELATMDVEAARQSRVEAAYDRVAEAVENLREDLSQVEGGAAWLPYVRADRLAEIAANNDASESARELLSGVHGKIAGRDRLGPEQADFLGRPSFVALESALENVLDAAAWSPPAEYQEQLLTHLEQLIAALEAYEEDGGSEAAAQVRRQSREISRLSPDGGRTLMRALRETYLNYNLRIVASEGLMRRFVSDTRTEPGVINEPVSEAWVTGRSCTITNVTVDVKPHEGAARFDILLDGTVRATTTANASQAVVYGGSTGSFHARKPVYFDGYDFNLGTTQVSANVSTYATDVDAKVFFLLRPIADHIAEREVQKRRAQTNATARQRVVSQVREEMDAEVGEQFSGASTKLQADLYGPLRELGWYPDVIKLHSTETEVVARARLMEPGELGAHTPAWVPAVPPQGIVVQVHESLLNNGSERLDLAGRTMTQDELRAELESRMQTLLGEDFSFSSDEGDAPQEPTEAEGPQLEDDGEPAEENVFMFDEVDPLRFEIGEGALSIILRTGLKREGEADIEAHIITVPLSFRVEGDQVVMQRTGNVRVVPAPGVRRNIPQQGIMRRNIEAAISDRTFDSELTLEQEGRTVTLHVQDIVATDGWITVTAN